MREKVLVEVYILRGACACNAGKADKETLRFNDVVTALRDEYKNVIFRVWALNVNLAQFRNNQEMATILQEEGHGALPVVFVNGKVAFKGAFPELEQLRSALGVTDMPPA